MSEEVFSSWGVIIAFFIGLAGLGTFIWNAIKGYNKRQDEKDATRRKLEEDRDAIIKKDVEQRAILIKQDAERTATDVKREVEQRAIVVKEEIASTARLLREHNQLLIDNVLKQITQVDEKVMKLLNDLSQRADMTNGNVGKIRTEIQQVKEDIEDLWDRLDDTDHALGVDDKAKDARARQKRQQDFDRRRKRKEIKDTEEQQGEMNKGYREQRDHREQISERNWDGR